MDNATLALYLHELRNQCLYTESAFQIFNQSLENNVHHGAFMGGQAILLSASNICSIIWPTRARAKNRGEHLRKALQLPENHPLSDRRLANMWEYSDEKLEDWILATKGETVIFDHLGSIPEIQGKSVDDDKIYRLYDPATRILYFRGSGFSLPALADAIADVYKRVVPLHRQLLPDQYPDASEALEVKTDDQPDKPERPANKKGKAKRPPKKTSVAKKTRKSSKRSAPKSSTAQ